MPEGADGRPYLFISDIDAGHVVIRGGGDGGDVVRDTGIGSGGGWTPRGSTYGAIPVILFIWVAVGLALLGLGITFYVPRRRLWVRVTDQRTQLAGVAARTTRFGRELRHMGAELGATGRAPAGGRGGERRAAALLRRAPPCRLTSESSS